MKRIFFIFLLKMIAICSFSQTYDPAKAADYAKKWCNGRNPEYVDYTNLGGDCAAFVSQCLIAGGFNFTGAPNVKPDGVISGAKALVEQLRLRQDTEYTPIVGYHPSAEHVVGDPMFQCYDNPNQHVYTAKHSLICSSVEFDSLTARRLYSAHYADNCDDDWPNNLVTSKLIFFHINSTLLKHCTDCKKNYGEEEIDCGGSCPPCEHAPQHKSFVTPTNNLPSRAYALEKITAGNAAVEVLSGQDVSFNTLGEIVLLPGFEAQEGSDFTAQIKNNIHEVTAFCGRYCGTEYYPNELIRYQDNLSAHDLVNVDKVYYEIYNLQSGSFIHSEVVYVTKEGILPLWNLKAGESSYPPSVALYIAKIIVYPCQGGAKSYDVKFRVTMPGKSLNEDSEETEKPVTSPPQNPENTISPNGNTTPSFSILPNPNPGTFQLETNFPLSTIGNLKITNLMGTPVYETQNVTSNTIQLPNPTTGTFFVVMVLKDGTVLSRKMVVQ